MLVEFPAAIPIFRIFSVEKAKEFYIDFLGFQVDWEHRFEATAPLYMQISRGGLSLHLSEHYGDCCPGASVYVKTLRLREFHAELTAKNYTYLHPGIGRPPWGGTCMDVIDPFGNRLSFNEEA